LHHHADAVNAFQKLEDPAQGWPLRRLVDLGIHLARDTLLPQLLAERA